MQLECCFVVVPVLFCDTCSVIIVCALIANKKLKKQIPYYCTSYTTLLDLAIVVAIYSTVRKSYIRLNLISCDGFGIKYRPICYHLFNVFKKFTGNIFLKNWTKVVHNAVKPRTNRY